MAMNTTLACTKAYLERTLFAAGLKDAAKIEEAIDALIRERLQKVVSDIYVNVSSGD